MASQKMKAQLTKQALSSPLYQGVLEAHWTQGMERFSRRMNLPSAMRNGREDVVNCGDGGVAGFVCLPLTLTETDKVVEFCKVSRVSAINRHPDCGAEEIFARHHGVEGDHALEFIDAWYADVSRKTRLPIGQTPITRPEGFHPEPMVVYDGLGINPALLKGAPHLFHVSRLYYPLDREGGHDAAGHCGTYTDIMFSSHGLGEGLDVHKPGIILIIGNPRAGLCFDKLREELAGINRHRLGRLIVTGFDYCPR